MQVHQILRSKDAATVHTVPSSMTVSDAVRMLSEKRIGALIVSDDDGRTPAGIISERDIVREIGRRGPACLDDRVADMMTAKVITASPSDPADQVLAEMTDGRFRHMPVMEGDEMIGLISIGDAVQARLRELAMEKEALTGMIMGN